MNPLRAQFGIILKFQPSLFPHWYKAGITTFLDLLNSDRSMKTLEELKTQFNIKSNFLEYLRLQRCFKRYLTNCDTDVSNVPRPFLPPNLKILISQKKGCRNLYQELNKQAETHVLRNKWCITLNINIDEKDWEQTYNICFKTLQINYLIWFQYRIIHRILGTHSYLKKTKNQYRFLM